MKRFILLAILALGVSFSSMSYSSTVLNDAENEIVIEQYTEVGLDVLTFDNLTVADVFTDVGKFTGANSINTVAHITVFECELISNKLVIIEAIPIDYGALMYRHEQLHLNLTGNNRAFDSLYKLRARDGLTAQGNSRS